MIRAFPNDAVLQEFSVYGEQDKNGGRADYLVCHFYVEEKSANLLLEAKASVANQKTYADIKNFIKIFTIKFSNITMLKENITMRKHILTQLFFKGLGRQNL